MVILGQYLETTNKAEIVRQYTTRHIVPMLIIAILGHFPSSLATDVGGNSELNRGRQF